MENYYDILGVKWNASQEEIKAGYREQLRRFHPDVTEFEKEYAEERIIKIVDAYKVLSNPAQRRIYNGRLVMNWTKTYYNENLKEHVDCGVAKVKNFWAENIGVEIDWGLVLALLSMPLLIEYSFAFWSSLLMFVAVGYVCYRLSKGLDMEGSF